MPFRENCYCTGASHILIVSDSQAGLKAILSTAPRAGQFRSIQYDRLVRAAVSWTPAHIGTTGNEFADDAAEAATRLPPSSAVPVSLTTCKRSIDSRILQRWKAQWKVSTPGRGLREIDDSPPSLILRSPYLSAASRGDMLILAQLRTDFSALNAHRFRCRLVLSPACGAAKETRAHSPPLSCLGSLTPTAPAQIIQGRCPRRGRCPDSPQPSQTSQTGYFFHCSDTSFQLSFVAPSFLAILLWSLPHLL
jgi:hypothetical protein